MKKKYLFSMATAFLLAVAGCSDDLEKGSDNQGKPLDGEGVYLTVNIMTPASSGSSSRATGDANSDPTGGEYGDGDLEGYWDENYVRSVTVIVYDGTDINDENAKIVASGYQDQVLNQGEDNTYDQHHYSATVLIKGGDDFEINKEYHVLTVVNQDVSSKYPVYTSENPVTLGTQDIKNATVTAHRVTGVTDGGFIMSTHKESINDKSSTVTFTEQSKESQHAAETTVWVERLSARIDYIGKIATFEVTDNNTKIADVTIDGIVPINVATHENYIFKRVTGTMSDANVTVDFGTAPVTLLGDELPNNPVSDPYSSSHAAGLNYVVEPTSSELGKKTFDNPFVTGMIDNLEFKTFSTIVAANDINPTTDVGRERIICYTGENTMGVNSQTHGRTTGVIFKATYTPTTVWSLGNNGLEEISLSEGTGFYRVGTLKRHNVMNEGSVLYASLEAAEAACIANDKSSDDQKTFGKKFNTETYFTSKTWSELEELVSNIATDLGYKAYLQTKINAETNKSATITDGSALTWDAYTNSRTNKYPNNTQEANQSIEEEGNLAIHYYGTDHLCYYQYWIRHANNGKPNEMGVMEFCIVRNNVYQLDVTGVDGLGMPDPYDNIDTPNEGEDPEGYYLKVQLYVKDWVKRLNNNIILQ